MWGGLPESSGRSEGPPYVRRARPSGRASSSLIRFGPSVATELGELLRLAELLQRRLRLRIDADQVTPRVGDAEHGVVDVEAKHRPDEIDVLLEPVLVDSDVVVLQLLPEVGHHRIVDDEVRRHALAAGGLLRDPRVPFGGVLLRVV